MPSAYTKELEDRLTAIRAVLTEEDRKLCNIIERLRGEGDAYPFDFGCRLAQQGLDRVIAYLGALPRLDQ